LNYRDTIVWFPRINQEVFLPQEISKKWTSEDLEFDIGPGVSDVYHPQEISFENPQHVNIPGTGELLYLANSVSFPRYDGIRYLKKAAELIGEKETQASINYKIADMYVWAGSKEQALPYYENSLRFDSSNANTRLNIVDMCTAIYKNRQAMEQLSYLYDKKQINFPHRLLFAKFNMYAGQFVQSKKILDEAEAINPYTLPEITDLRGRFYLLANDPNKAISFYKTYLTTKPVDANTCYTLARLYAGKKNNPEAFIWLEKAINSGFNYSFILKEDPLMTWLSKTDKWNLVIKKIKGKDWNKTNTDAINGDN
jgi:tetratricopeptide (TPR) repeat protein